MNKQNNETDETLKGILLQKKGGKTTAKIIELLLVRPYNSNQVAKILNISYNTAYYHFQIMLKFNLIEKIPTKYGTYYVAKKNLINEKDTFNEIKKLI
ncbi:MAG: winged helix-turn-helix domain-containing protein [Methanobrevibacter sp.]|nr:winged helix-turn-helix domain-containing protein [Methanobrevibacter sp.]